MTKMFLKKWWAALISLSFLGGGMALACADGWGDEYGVSNFTPEIFVDSSYSPFFYSYQFYYGINYDQNQHTRFNDANIREWTSYFNKQVNRDELQYWLQNASVSSIDSATSYIAGKLPSAPAFMQSLNLLKQKSNTQCVSFFTYLRLAKKSEIFALNDIPDPWGGDTKPAKKTFDDAGLYRDLKDGFTKTSDAFLKERYWFQLLRFYFFNYTAKETIDFFNTTEKGMPHNDMYFRTLAYTAGAYYKLKNYSKANYNYSLVYDSCNELKTTAHYSFHPQEEKDWIATLALCRNNNEKATLWQMLGVFYADEQRAINQIYQINPASDKLDLLLARAVNKYEQKFSYKGSASTDLVADTTAAAALPALITKIATAANTGKPWIWQIAAGYINSLDKKYVAAANWFSKAEKSIPGNDAAHAQLRLLKLINNIGQAKRIDAVFEKEVLADIEWLKKIDAKTIPGFRYNDAFAWLKQTMAAKYMRQKDWVKSECFYSNTSFYATNKNVEALKTFLAKNDKTAYESLCTDLCEKKISDLFEFQAIQLTYTDSLDAAFEKMEKAGPGALAELAGNPFNGRIQDCHDCDHAAPQKIKYTKLSFLKKLKELKEKTNTGADVYNNAMLLANAHYNISHFGNARFFYESKIVGSDQSDPAYIDSLFRKMLTGMPLAKKYYTLCLQNAATDEQKAKCQYMLAKCQRNDWYFQNIYGKGDNPYNRAANLPDFMAWDGFKALKQYSNTQYYKDVIKECSYFKTYSRK